MIGIDHEYIAEDAPQGDTPSPVRPDVENTYCEIMQMGACKLDKDGQEVGVLNLIVRAHKIHTIPPWLVRMTGMTEGKRATGVTFPQALQQLVEFVGDDTDLWTYGGDWFVLRGNAAAHGIELPFAPFNRLKLHLAEKGITEELFKAKGLTEMSSGGLYKVLGINLPHIEGVGVHDAAHDARSLAHAVYALKLQEP